MVARLLNNRTARILATFGGLLWIGLILLGDRHDFWGSALGPITYERYNRLLTLPLLLFVISWLSIHLHYAKHDRLGHATSLLILFGYNLLLFGNVLEFWVVLLTNYLPFRLDRVNGWPGAEIGWVMFVLGCIFVFVGLFLFGIATLRSRLLPYWNAIPLIASIVGSVCLLLAIFGQSLGTTFEHFFSYALIVLGVKWLLMGFVLKNSSDQAVSLSPILRI